MSNADKWAFIAKFLTTLDRFAVTSPDSDKYNFMDNDDLSDYWCKKGVIQDE